MKPQRQRIVSRGIGDCFAACMASILELPIEVLPNDHSPGWSLTWDAFLQQFGISMTSHAATGPIWHEGYWIAAVPSLNFDGVSHAIVMQGHRVAFDPSTKKRYKKGTPMLDVVTSGTYFVVDDFTQIHRLHEYRECLRSARRH